MAHEVIAIISMCQCLPIYLLHNSTDLSFPMITLFPVCISQQVPRQGKLVKMRLQYCKMVLPVLAKSIAANF